MKKIIAICLIALMCFSSVNCVNANSPEIFKIGITDYEPMNYYNSDGELVGFDIELAKYVCEKMGMVPEFVHIDWDNKDLELEAGFIDCIWTGLIYSDYRATYATTYQDFSYPYAKASDVIVIKGENSGKYKSLDEMLEFKFAVEDDSIRERIANDYGLNYISVMSEGAALQAVQTGKADACIVYSLSANKLLNNSNFSDLKVVSTLSEENFVIALKKDSPYTKKINDTLSMAKEEGVLYNLGAKYNVDICWSGIPDFYDKVTFKDVSSNHWAYDYICKMSQDGVISGYGNGLFGPEDNITRAQFATMLCRIADIKTTDITNITFSDVFITDWYAVYVEGAKPYFEGYNDNTYYNPTTYAKREDIAEALVKYKGYDTSFYNENEFKTFFVDWEEINADARKYVYTAVKHNLISGYDDKTFRGEANITRAEAATLFYKLSR